MASNHENIVCSQSPRAKGASGDPIVWGNGPARLAEAVTTYRLPADFRRISVTQRESRSSEEFSRLARIRTVEGCGASTAYYFGSEGKSPMNDTESRQSGLPLDESRCEIWELLPAMQNFTDVAVQICTLPGPRGGGGVRGAFPGEGVVGRVVAGLSEAALLLGAACACE